MRDRTPRTPQNPSTLRFIPDYPRARWEQLDAVDWAALEHHHGSAEDVPGLFRRCAGPDPDDAAAASHRLRSTLYHQGGWICSAASAALPFPVEVGRDATGVQPT